MPIGMGEISPINNPNPLLGRFGVEIGATMKVCVVYHLGTKGSPTAVGATLAFDFLGQIYRALPFPLIFLVYAI